MHPLMVLYKKDGHILANLNTVLRRESRFKVLFILAFALGLFFGLYAAFLSGFRFLSILGGAGFMVTRYLFSLIFLALGVMMVLSGIITSYSSLFRSRDSILLLTSPIPDSSLVLYKFTESCLLSSWAFFFIILPYTLAYAVHEKLSPFFVGWTLLFSIPYLILCSGLGTIFVLLFIRWIPRHLREWVILFGLIAAGLLAYYVRPTARPGLDDSQFLLSRLIPGLQLASNPLGPNWWTSEGIMSLARGQVGRGLLLWGVLVSNTLLVIWIVRSLGQLLFARACQRLWGIVPPRRRQERLGAALDHVLSPFGSISRGLALKDIRTFLRDPMQWSQSLIFFGLLGFYFASLRTFRYHALPDVWRNLIVFLNVFSVAAVLCSLSSRFVYPQLSLEGQAFWIIGLSPAGMRRVLLTKFFTALAAMATISAALIALSTTMLGVAPLLKGVTISLSLAIALGTCGLSTGLGAIFLNLKQSNPMAIVSSFGGTLNLALSLMFMAAVILPCALPFHFFCLEKIGPATLHHALEWIGPAVIALTLLTTLLPLWLGLRSLQRREY